MKFFPCRSSASTCSTPSQRMRDVQPTTVRYPYTRYGTTRRNRKSKLTRLAFRARQPAEAERGGVPRAQALGRGADADLGSFQPSDDGLQSRRVGEQLQG